jgi:BirA family transcriptional regulator, biotin operon repressor / biotin---[acetyl-CoA-carboxylase] ligase
MSHCLDVQSSGWPFVKTAVAYDVVDSTSDRAAELVCEGRHELPLLVWARTQTRGRGRGGNRWWSDDDSLTFTVAIDPLVHGLTAEHEPRLALATAVAVIDALNELGLGSPSLGIRWPNDLEVDGRKLGGILPEVLDTPRGRVMLVGIGLNVRTSLASAPADVRAMATSLAELHPKPLDETVSGRLLPVIMVRLGSVLPRLAAADSALSDRWGQLDLLRETWVRVDLGTHQVAGWGQGIDHDGALCLHDGQHLLRIFGGQVLRSPL